MLAIKIFPHRFHFLSNHLIFLPFCPLPPPSNSGPHSFSEVFIKYWSQNWTKQNITPYFVCKNHRTPASSWTKYISTEKSHMSSPLNNTWFKDICTSNDEIFQHVASKYQVHLPNSEENFTLPLSGSSTWLSIISSILFALNCDSRLGPRVKRG